MKKLLSVPVIAIAALHVAVSGAAEPPAGTQPSKPTPTQLRIRHYLKQTVEAYDAVGTKDPRWDESARTALRQAATIWGRFPEQNSECDVDMMRATQAAVDVGCQDPLVLYIRARSVGFYRRPASEIAPLDRQAMDGMAKSGYPPLRKVFSYFRCAEFSVRAAPGDEAVRKEARQNVERAIELIPEIAQDPDLVHEDITGLVDLSGSASEVIENSHLVIRNRVVTALEKSHVPKSVVLSALAEDDKNWAWAARGGGWAGTVTEKGWGLMAKRLATARSEAEEAWRLDPNNEDAARVMISVELGDSHGRDAMETWYQRAVHIDPDDTRLYVEKLYWLEPKWHGTPEAMLEYARECAKNPGSRFAPLTLVNAHWNIGRYDAEGYPAAPDRKYFQKTPEAWPEIKAVYDHFFEGEKNPSHFEKTRYGVIAAYCGQWKAAHEIFASIPKDRFAQTIFYNDEPMNALVREVEEKAAAEKQ